MNKCIAALLALLATGSAIASDMTPILSNGPGRSEREEYANKATSLLFHRTLFGEGDPLLAADLFVAPTMISHDIDEPSGGENFAQFFANPEKYNNPNTTLRGDAPRSTSAGQLTRLFTVTDGDITLMAFPGEGDGDPGAQFASNMWETKLGRVTQLWFSGPTMGGNMMALGGAGMGGAGMGGGPAGAPPAGAPPAGAFPGGAAPAAGATTAGAPGAAMPGGAPGGVTGAAPARDFSRWYQGGYTVAGMPMLIGTGKATRAQRDANKKLVGEFFDEFFNKKSAAAAGKYLSADLKSHIGNSPQGSAFAEYARTNPDKVTAPNTSRVLFLLGDGELVAIGWPREINGDPGAWYGVNLLRVQGGKIVEWWYSGYPSMEPRKANPWNSVNNISNTSLYEPGK